MAAGHATRAIACDVTDRPAFLAALREAGDLDIFVSNAGHAETAPLKRMDGALFDRMIALNLTAVFDGIHAVLPGMVARGRAASSRSPPPPASPATPMSPPIAPRSTASSA